MAWAKRLVVYRLRGASQALGLHGRKAIGPGNCWITGPWCVGLGCKLAGLRGKASVGPVQEAETWVGFGPKLGSNWAQQNNKTNSNINKIKYDKQ